MNARLKVLHQKSNVKIIKLQPTTTIGRSAECDLKIASNLVSRVHCRITVNEQAVFVEDLGSANGTFVDGEALEPNQSTLVNPGAKLVVGPAEFIVEYVTETSNTIVIRRSSEGAKPALQELKNFMSSGDSGLLLNTSAKSPDPTGPDASTPMPRPSPVAPKSVEAARPVIQPDPIVVQHPVLERPTPLFQKAPVGSPVPNVAPKVPSVPVASPPVAKVVSVMPAPVEPPAAPRRAEPVQPQPVVVSQPVAAAPISPPKAAPPAAPTEQPFGFVEFEEAPISQSDQSTQFNFEDATNYQLPPKSAEKDKKEKPLKSLFSMFGGKPKPAKPSSPTSEPSESNAVPEPAAENVVQEGATELPFGTPSMPPESASESSDGKVDDDFQNFLSQF